MASSSKDASGYPAVVESDPVVVESDNESDATTNSSEVSDQSQVSKKTNDSQDDLGDSSNPKGSGAPSVTLSSIVPDDFDPEFFDAKLQGLNDTSSIQALVDEYKNKAAHIAKLAAAAKKFLTIVKKLEAKKLEEEKRGMEAEFILNVSVNGKSFSMTATKSTTVKDIREYVVTKAKMKKGDHKKIVIPYKGEAFEHGRKTMGGLGVADGAVLVA